MLQGAVPSELARQMLQSLGRPVPPHTADLPLPLVSHAGMEKSAFEQACMPVIAGVQESGQACTLCRKSISLKQELSRAPCSHLFHRRCLNKWLRKSSECPSCCRNAKPTQTASCTGHPTGLPQLLPQGMKLLHAPLLTNELQMQSSYGSMPFNFHKLTAGLEVDVSRNELEMPSCEVSTPPLSMSPDLSARDSNSTLEAASTSTAFEAPFALEESDASDFLDIIADDFQDCLLHQGIADSTEMYELCTDSVLSTAVYSMS